MNSIVFYESILHLSHSDCEYSKHFNLFGIFEHYFWRLLAYLFDRFSIACFAKYHQRNKRLTLQTSPILNQFSLQQFAPLKCKFDESINQSQKSSTN
jgi:hypothetical protein